MKEKKQLKLKVRVQENEKTLPNAELSILLLVEKTTEAKERERRKSKTTVDAKCRQGAYAWAVPQCTLPYSGCLYQLSLFPQMPFHQTTPIK